MRGTALVGAADPLGRAWEDGRVSQPTGRPARYQRTFNGLVVAMVVTVLVVVAFTALRSLLAPDVEAGPASVDYRETVGLAQEAGYVVVYPPRLPAGWTATSVDLTAGERPAWRVGFLTDEGRFVGVRQANDSIEDLLDTYVDEDATAGDTVELDSQVATTWQSWTDDGGDLAFSAEAGDDIVLVYGSADETAQQLLIGLLTTEPLPADGS